MFCSEPVHRLVLLGALAVAFSGCVEVTPIQHPRSLDHYTWRGYVPGATRTVDAGATVAFQTDTTAANPNAQARLVLEQSCKVIDHALLDNVVGTRTLDLAPGPLHVDATIASPTSLYLQKFPGNPGKGSALYLAVHPDGTIADRLWTGWVGEKKLDRNVAKITLDPADCHYIPSTATSSVATSVSRPTGVTIVYVGRDPSGLLKFAQLQGGYFMRQVVTPAEPGEYSVLGLQLRIVGVNGYRLTYEVVSR